MRLLLAQITPADLAAVLPLVDRFGFALLTCIAFGFAVRALWMALQQKETAHRAEREADRTAHLEKLSAIAGDVHAQGAQLAEVRRDVDRIADRVAAMVPRVAALLLLGLVLAGACSKTVDTASQIDAQASSTSSTSSTAHQVVTGDVERSRSEAPTTTTVRTVIERFAADTFDAGDEVQPTSGAPHAAPQLHATCGARCSPSPALVAPRLYERQVTTSTTTTGQVLELEHAGMAAAGSSVATQATSSTAKASGQATDHVKTKAGIPWGLVLVGLAVLALAIAAVLVARKFNLVSVVAALAKRALGALGG